MICSLCRDAIFFQPDRHRDRYYHSGQVSKERYLVHVQFGCFNKAVPAKW
jgi:hypothetical protein